MAALAPVAGGVRAPTAVAEDLRWVDPAEQQAAFGRAVITIDPLGGGIPWSGGFPVRREDGGRFPGPVLRCRGLPGRRAGVDHRCLDQPGCGAASVAGAVDGRGVGGAAGVRRVGRGTGPRWAGSWGAAGSVRSASSARTSDSRNRRCLPGVRMQPIRPLDAHRDTVLGSTRNSTPTCREVSSRSVWSMVTVPTSSSGPARVSSRFGRVRAILHPRVSRDGADPPGSRPSARVCALLCGSLRMMAARPAAASARRSAHPAAQATTTRTPVARRPPARPRWLRSQRWRSQRAELAGFLLSST